MECSYLVAADGAKSRIRDMIGVALEGQPVMQNLVNIHFTAPDLAQRLRQERPAMLYFVFNPKGVVVVVAHDLTEGDFVAQVRSLAILSASLQLCMYFGSQIAVLLRRRE